MSKIRALVARSMKSVLWLSKEKTERIGTEEVRILMALAGEAKKQVISKYRVHKTDTGSPEVQVAILSQRIAQLTEHFKSHKKDHHSRLGLLTMVSRRRRLLKYLKSSSPERYKTLITGLGIRSKL